MLKFGILKFISKGLCAMKKFCVAVYLLALALMVFTMSGCGGSSGGDVQIQNQTNNQTDNNTNGNTNQNQNGNTDTNTNTNGNTNTETQAQAEAKAAQSKRMIISSPALKRGESYRLYRGSGVKVSGTTAKYYAAPSAGSTEKMVMNLEFSSAVSEDLPFIITDSTGTNVLFSYNPAGSPDIDTTTATVLRNGGANYQLKYTNLTLSAASVELEESEGIIDIVLKSDGTATVSGDKIEPQNYVWHIDPQHPAEYWTEGYDGTTEYTEKEYKKLITDTYGVYIARDVRYTPNTLEFDTANTAKKDEDTEYVVYYDSSSSEVAKAIAALSDDYGAAYSRDKYILATLPMSGGMGGAPGEGGMPSGDMPGNPPSDGNPGQPPAMNASAASDIATFATMTHSSSDAYANPVLHITEPGTYRLSGTWKGQIWVDVGGNSDDVVGLILNGVNVECTVAPALVFYKVYKWAEDNGYDSQDVLAKNDLWKNIGDKMLSGDYYVNGAIVEIADGTTNTFTGANTYRILELCPKIDDDTDLPKYNASEIGGNISAQEKMYKLDGAFHSRRTMVIGGGSKGTGTLNITSSTYEGLDSEMHMLISGGNITVTAPDDAINVNEDYVSVFQMDSGTMTISSTNADGIDSNGWVSINGGTLNITAGTASTGAAGEAGIDAENGYYISSNATYNWTAASSGGGTTPGGTTSGDQSGNNSNTGTNTNTGTTLAVTTTTKTLTDGTVFTLFPTSADVETDTEGARNIPESGDTFPLVHRVNDFSGITAK